MADTLDITAGAGTTIATDDVGGVHYQEIKLVNGTKDSATPVAVDVGVKANALRVAPANDITDATYIGDIKFGEAEPNSAAILADTTAMVVDLAAMEALLITIDADTSNLSVVGGGTEAAAIRVTLANDSTGVLTVDDGGGALTVDGTVTANLSATDNAVLDTIDAVLDLINAKLVTGTVIGDVNLGATDNAVLDDIAARVTSAETDLAAIEALLITIDADTSNLSVVGGGTEAAAIRVTIANDSTGVLSVDDGGGALTVDGTVTANLSATDNAVLDTIDAVLDLINAKLVTGTVIGDVNLGATDNAVLDDIAARVTSAETALQIVDDWDATHDSAASADGPQLMAAYDATKPTAVADGDAVRVLADEYGRLLPGVEKTVWQAVYDSADASGEGEVVKASAASTILVVQFYKISSDVEQWVKLQDEDSTAVTGKHWIKAGGGVAITLPYNAPIMLGVDKDLEVITEGAGDVSVTATGYTIPG